MTTQVLKKHFFQIAIAFLFSSSSTHFDKGQNSIKEWENLVFSMQI